MIEVETVWIPQILAYAEIVLERESIQDCWVHCNCKSTSVTSFDEMIEQIFDDLDSDSLLETARSDANISLKIVNSIDELLIAIKKVDEAKESGSLANAPESLLASALWRIVADRAVDLINVAALVGYKSMR
ncbi:hypothetical protein BHUM_01452 [Candidatus Burkholderia humilis]|nr:hypothetical protein BHUM_01452 [Candidatus Burkholderia humilis]